MRGKSVKSSSSRKPKYVLPMARNDFCMYSGMLSCVRNKVNTSFKINRCAGALLMATTLASQGGDQIQVYTVPKEHPANQPAQAQMAAGASDIPVNSAPIRWTLPEGWKQKPADGIRLGSFAINGENGGKAEVSITSFPGSVGTELGNVNRWRGELSLAPVGAADLVSEPVTVDSFQGKLFDIAGASARTVVAIIPRNGSSWFIKLRGDAATVAEAKPVFLEFLKSVHFGGDAVEAAPVGGASVGTDPHAGLGLQGIPAAHGGPVAPDASSDAPKWNVPAQWAETAPSSGMIFKSFSVSGDAGAKADVTVSFFPGDVGGVLANVNRWRGQMGQAPIEPSQLDGVTESFATLEGKATLTDIMGTDAKTGQPARLLAAIVPHGDKTWFYKVMGNGKVVEAQKNSFVEFVRTVQY
jgi:hypothetical protein